MVNNQVRQRSVFSSKIKNFIEELFRSHPYGYGLARYLAGKFFYKILGEKDFEAFKYFKFPTNKYFLDVGANDGISALSFYHFNKINPIISFEPDDYHFKSLEKLKNKLNKFEFKIMGLSSIKNKIKLYIPKVSGIYIGQLASTNKEEAFSNVFKILTTKNLEKKTKIIEKTISVDTIDNLKLDVCAIKIDVEGHELEVLKGAKTTLKNQLPILLIELKINDSEKIYSFLKKLGYELFIYENKKLNKTELKNLALENNEFITNAFFINPRNNYNYSFINTSR